MSKINLINTKQGKQITKLRNRLEKSGWTIVRETEREFNGKPRWEFNDETPNLIYSWSIQRNLIRNTIWLDFIAWWDCKTYEIHVNDCSHCQIRGQEIQLDFIKDKGLRIEKELQEWMERLNKFQNNLNKIEKNNLKEIDK